MAEAETAPEAPRVIVPQQADWKGRFAAFAISWAVRIMSWTVRFRFDDSAKFFAEKNPGPMIFCVWHNRLFLSAIVYQKWQKRIGMKRAMAGLVSASRDGAVADPERWINQARRVDQSVLLRLQQFVAYLAKGSQGQR